MSLTNLEDLRSIAKFRAVIVITATHAQDTIGVAKSPFDGSENHGRQTNSKHMAL